MIRRPRFEKYPEWLHEYITEQAGSEIIGNRSKLCNAEKNLRKVFEEYRTSPVSATLFDTTIDTIRLRFMVFELQEELLNRISVQADQIRKQSDRIDKFEKKLKKLSKKKA